MDCVAGRLWLLASHLDQQFTLYPITADRAQMVPPRWQAAPYDSLPTAWKHYRQGCGYRFKARSADAPLPNQRPHGLFTPIRELFGRTQESRSRWLQGWPVFLQRQRRGRWKPCQGGWLDQWKCTFMPDIL